VLAELASVISISWRHFRYQTQVGLLLLKLVNVRTSFIMEAAFYIVVMATLAAVVAVDRNEEFCKKYMPTGNKTNPGLVPVFYDNFYVFIERKDIINTGVVYLDQFYCQAAGRVYGTYRAQASQSQFWVNGNLIMDMTLSQDQCINRRSDEFSTTGLHGVIVSSSGTVTLSSPEVALGWNKKAVYDGPSSHRGIATNRWFFCTFDSQTATTTVNEWHFADQTASQLPELVQNEAVALPVVVIIRGLDNTSPSKPIEFLQRLDLTFFDSVQPLDPILQITPSKLCSGNASAQVPLPTAPSYFKFKGEQITVVSSEPANIVYTVEEYTQLAQLFIQEQISPPSASSLGNDKSFARMVNDYASGLSFNLDLETGKCRVAPIANGIDSIPVAGGNVRMRNSKQFFDLDSNQYQYMGVQMIRGIECDTWSAYFLDGQSDHEQDELYIWYFATTNWKKTYNLDVTTALPVALEIQQTILGNIDTQFNFYEFDTLDYMRIPDVSLCFNHTNTLNVEFFISASYSKYVAPNLQLFYKSIYQGLIPLTISALRISSLDIQPAAVDDIVVRFKLLEIIPLQTMGTTPTRYTSNNDVYKNLNTAVNTGTFNFDITESAGKVTVRARPNSVSLFQDGGINNSNSASSGYSTGAMAGIGIGMIVVGLVLGVVAVFAVKKVRGGSDPKTFNMAKLSEESSS
jgi:hypothetical protein